MKKVIALFMMLGALSANAYAEPNATNTPLNKLSTPRLCMDLGSLVVFGGKNSSAETQMFIQEINNEINTRKDWNQKVCQKYFKSGVTQTAAELLLEHLEQ